MDIKFNIYMNILVINNKTIYFSEYQKQIFEFNILDNHIYILTNKGWRNDYSEYEISNNIFKFDFDGNLIYRTGLLKLEKPVFGEKEFEASNLSIQDDKLYLGYGIGYEAWADIKTGEIIHGQFEGRK